MKIRVYQKEDCNEIVDLFKNTVHSINAKDYSEDQLNAWAPEKIDCLAWDKSFSGHYAIVAEENCTVVGFGDIDDSGYFDRLYVHKNHQRQGIATKIANKLEAHAFENGVQEISTRASITAKPFFEKRGYKVIKEQTIEREGQLLTNFVMKKIARNNRY